MWNAWNRRPLSMQELIFIAEQNFLIPVKALQDLPPIHSPLFGTIGPFVKGMTLEVPLYVVETLVEEELGFPQLPYWLREGDLRLILKNEVATGTLLMTPHPNYIEVSSIFFDAAYNAWNDLSQRAGSRQTVMRLFESYIQLRRNKIGKLNDRLIQNGIIDTTALSTAERCRLAVPAAEFCQKLQRSAVTSKASLEELLLSMGVPRMDEHVQVMQRCAQLENER